VARDVYFRDDVRNGIMAGLGLFLELEPGTTERLKGALALARHQAIVFGISFDGVCTELAGRAGLAGTIRKLLESGGQEHER